MITYHNPKEEKEDGKKNDPVLLLVVLCLLGFGYFFFIYPYPFRSSHHGGTFTACQSNLKNIGTALEMYSTDNNGNYPFTLTQLTPNYLKAIPSCPVAQTDKCYIYSYSCRQSPDQYTFYCKGKYHKNLGVKENYPQYNSNEGLVSGK